MACMGCADSLILNIRIKQCEALYSKPWYQINSEEWIF